MANTIQKWYKELLPRIKIDTVDDEALGVENETDVVESLVPVQQQWRKIGRFLLLTSTALDDVETEAKLKNAASCTAFMIHRWLSGGYDYHKYGNPSWKMVVMAIAKGAQDNRHAQQVADTHRWPWTPRPFEPPDGTEVEVEQNEIDPEKDHFEIVDTMEMLQRQLSHRWDCLARQLNLRRQDIHDIRTKDMNDSDRIHLVIEKWLQHQTELKRSHELPTWRWLVAAVRSQAGGDNPKLADKIALEHRVTQGSESLTFPETRPPALDVQQGYRQGNLHQAPPIQTPPSDHAHQAPSPPDDSNEQQQQAMFLAYQRRPSGHDEVSNSPSVPSTGRANLWAQNQSRANDNICDSDVSGYSPYQPRRSTDDNIWDDDDDDFDICINEEVEDDSIRNAVRSVLSRIRGRKRAKAQEDTLRASRVSKGDNTAIVAPSPPSVQGTRRGSAMMDIPFLYYPVSRFVSQPSSTEHRGICLIFSIQKYKDPTLNRRGAEVDARRVEQTFSRLGYRTIKYMDEKCSYEWMTSAFQKVCTDLGHWDSPDKCPHDSFVCYISAHGGFCPDANRDFIIPYDYSIDQEQPRVYLKELQAAIGPKKCPALATKPKIFFLQMCRGKQVLECVRLSVQPDAVVAVHENSDFFTSYSTSLENIALRDPVKGSWFTNDLCDILDPSQEVVKDYDLCTLVTEVHRRVSVNHEFTGRGYPYRQCPEMVHSLRQRFYFFEPRFKI